MNTATWPVYERTPETERALDAVEDMIVREKLAGEGAADRVVRQIFAPVAQAGTIPRDAAMRILQAIEYATLNWIVDHNEDKALGTGPDRIEE